MKAKLALATVVAGFVMLLIGLSLDPPLRWQLGFSGAVIQIVVPLVWMLK